jgi:hypothetical protein
MSKFKYKPSTRAEGMPYVSGPGNGLGYHGHTLNPDLTCGSEQEAERAARIANIAYQAGYNQAQFDIQKALGLAAQ